VARDRRPCWYHQAVGSGPQRFGCLSPLRRSKRKETQPPLSSYGSQRLGARYFFLCKLGRGRQNLDSRDWQRADLRCEDAFSVTDTQRVPGSPTP
jgi:hypothetical protein